MITPEFKSGDKVTFNPYGDAIPARVLEISKSPSFEPDDRVWYRLEGTDPRKPLLSVCTGNSIVESKLFKTNPESMSREQLEAAALEAIDPEDYYELRDSMDEMADEDLRKLIEDSQ